MGIGATKKIAIEYVSKESITSHKKISGSGESIIYQYGNDDVAKVFRENKNINYALKSLTIARVMQKVETLKKVTSTTKYKYIVPEKILVDNYQIYGYVMKKVNGLPLYALKEKQFVINELGFTKKDVFEILIEVGKGIERLHNENIFIGDLNGGNILFDKSKRVFFLDFDGMGVDELSPEFYTDWYIDPVSMKKHMVTQKDDWYSFAIQAFHYLTYTHPFNGIYEENGIALDVVTKMERRISLLGNHGMIIPTIAEPWDWMNPELKNTFYRIFEDEMRVSIVPHLIDQYKSLYGENAKLKDKSFWINQKFIAMENNPFSDENIKYAINLNVAVCEKDNQKYAIVLTNNHRYILKKQISYFEDLKLIKDIKITEDEKFAFVITHDKSFVVNLEEDTCIKSSSLTDDNNVIINGNSIYYMDFYKSIPVITKKTLNSGGEIEKELFNIDSEQQIPKCFGVTSNNKFVIVYSYSDCNDVIYCNNSKLCYIDCNCNSTKYNILYDNISRTWLVINEEGYIVVIKPEGTYTKFKIDDINTIVSINNVTYINGNLYLPNYDCLWIISVKNQCKVKKMECNKIMNPTSKICEVDRKGFSVVTNGILYKICKV